MAHLQHTEEEEAVSCEFRSGGPPVAMRQHSGGKSHLEQKLGGGLVEERVAEGREEGVRRVTLEHDVPNRVSPRRRSVAFGRTRSRSVASSRERSAASGRSTSGNRVAIGSTTNLPIASASAVVVESTCSGRTWVVDGS